MDEVTIMFNGLFKSFNSVLYLQLQPDQLTVRYLRWGKESVEFSDVPLMAVVDYPKRGPQVVAVGAAVKTYPRNLGPGETLWVNNAFGHPRTIIDDVDGAVIVVKHFLQQVHFGRRLISPSCVVQVLGNLDGGLTKLEKRGLSELGLALGASQIVLLNQPDRLTDDQLWEMTDRSLSRPITRDKYLNDIGS
jgi:rod shape-determining protein MreB and related proteins